MKGFVVKEEGEVMKKAIKDTIEKDIREHPEDYRELSAEDFEELKKELWNMLYRSTHTCYACGSDEGLYLNYRDKNKKNAVLSNLSCFCKECWKIFFKEEK